MEEKLKNLLILVILVVCISGCKSSFTDVSKDVEYYDLALPEIQHAYYATWLSSKTIIFLKRLNDTDFDPEFRFDPSTIVVHQEIYTFDLESQEWKKLDLDPDLDCHAQDIGGLQRLPNNRLGLIQSCRNDFLGIIQEFDVSSRTMHTLFRNDIAPNEEVEWVGPYSFSQEMTELIIEYPIGRYLENQLFYVKLGDKPQRIVPDFIRAVAPAWSPHKREIAFWGTARYHGDDEPVLEYTSDIIGLASYPWDMYMSSPSGENVRKVLASVENPGDIEWSPTKNVIAFSGTLRGTDGLWLIDPVTLEFIRIWNERVGFDWSPDGTQIVISVVDYGDYPELKDIRAHILQVPVTLLGK